MQPTTPYNDTDGVGWRPITDKQPHIFLGGGSASRTCRTKHVAGRLVAVRGGRVSEQPPSLHLGMGYLAGRSSQHHRTSLIRPAGCCGRRWGDTVVRLCQDCREPCIASGEHRCSGRPGQFHTSYKTVHSASFDTVAPNSMFYSQWVYRRMHSRL